jgi:hypothetical protein
MLFGRLRNSGRDNTPHPKSAGGHSAKWQWEILGLARAKEHIDQRVEHDGGLSWLLSFVVTDAALDFRHRT